MNRSIAQILNNEEGAALWVVIVICFIILFIVTSSFTYLLEHRQILQMRLQQLQAYEFVKNGVVFIKNKLVLREAIDRSSTIEYPSGHVEMMILDQFENELKVRISGFSGNRAVQTYEVYFDTGTGQVTQFMKKVIGME